MKLRVADVELHLGYEVAAALTGVLLLDREGRMQACILAVFLHESGHLLLMRLFRVPVHRIRIRLFDVLIEAGDAPSFAADVWITLGGALMNFLFAALLYPFCPAWSLPQVMLGVFNILPVMSLDGGHLLYLCLLRRFRPSVCGAVLRVTTFLMLLPLMTAGLYLLLKSGYNYSLLAISLYLLTILFLKSQVT